MASKVRASCQSSIWIDGCTLSSHGSEIVAVALMTRMSYVDPIVDRVNHSPTFKPHVHVENGISTLLLILYSCDDSVSRRCDIPRQPSQPRCHPFPPPMDNLCLHERRRARILWPNTKPQSCGRRLWLSP